MLQKNVLGCIDTGVVALELANADKAHKIRQAKVLEPETEAT